MRTIAAKLVVFAVLCCASSLGASLVALPLEKMVEQADLIVVGEVIRLEKTNLMGNFYKQTLPLYRATILVEKVLKGQLTEQEVQAYHTMHPEDAQFPLARDIVYFLQQSRITSDTQIRVLQGWHGEVLIIGDTVKPRFMDREFRRSEFLEKVRSLVIQQGSH